MSLFSVVIPTYNRAPLLQKTLELVFAQDFGDFEIIVADDGSTDDTTRVVHSFGDRIRLCRQENKGPGAARNLGARNSKGEYIAFLDSDDLWFPWTLATYAQIIKQEHRPTFLAGAWVFFQEDVDVARLTVKPLALESFPDYFAASRRSLYCGSGQMVVRRAAFLEAGGFAEGQFNAEDHDLVMRLGTAPGFVYVTAPAMLAYRQHPGGVTRDLSKTATGSVNLVHMENSGRYPGGTGRRRDRWRNLTRHIRPVTLELLHQREYTQAWTLYRQTFLWNLLLGRFRYLVGFWFKAATPV